jgi:hypothetical protein
MVGSSPVKTATSVSALGPVDKVPKVASPQHPCAHSPPQICASPRLCAMLIAAGSPQVGASLAAKKRAELVEAKERTTDGILYYTFTFKAVRLRARPPLRMNTTTPMPSPLTEWSRRGPFHKAAIALERAAPENAEATENAEVALENAAATATPCKPVL